MQDPLYDAGERLPGLVLVVDTASNPSDRYHPAIIGSKGLFKSFQAHSGRNGLVKLIPMPNDICENQANPLEGIEDNQAPKPPRKRKAKVEKASE